MRISPVRFEESDGVGGLRPVIKIWLDHDGKAFGEGPRKLLEGVERTGSLRQAAAEMHMSYNKAWFLLRTLEDRLGFALLERTVGGAAGGGSRLTPEAHDLVRRYQAFEREVDEAVRVAFARYFSDANGHA